MIPEESLRQAAQRAQEALLDSLPETPAAHTFSPAYRRKLARLARRMDRKPRPPHWVLHRVAGILLAVVCLGSVVLGTNAQAREAVFGWVRQWMEDGQHYFYQGEAPADGLLVPYRITVPDDYQLEEGRHTFRAEDRVSEHYVNQDGRYIHFSYVYGTTYWKNMTFFVDDGMERQEIELHGKPADLYLPMESDCPSTVIWIDQETGAFLEVTAFLEKDEMIVLAESVTPEHGWF